MRKSIVLFALLLAGLYAAAEAPYDVIIRNGHIIDGTGSPWYSGDVGIRDGKVVSIDAILKAGHVGYLRKSAATFFCFSPRLVSAFIRANPR